MGWKDHDSLCARTGFNSSLQTLWQDLVGQKEDSLVSDFLVVEAMGNVVLPTGVPWEGLGCHASSLLHTHRQFNSLFPFFLFKYIKIKIVRVT